MLSPGFPGTRAAPAACGRQVPARFPHPPEPPPHPRPWAQGACGHLGLGAGRAIRGVVAGRRRGEGKRGLSEPEPQPPESSLPPLPLLCGRPSPLCPGLGGAGWAGDGGRGPRLGAELLLGGGEARFLPTPMSQVGSAFLVPPRPLGAASPGYSARESSERAVPAPPALSARVLSLGA
jgi:hypothetical protein